MTNADGTRWIYQYDKLGQVIFGKKYWSDGTPVAGQQFEYGYDDIGNRTFAASGGDQWGTNLRYENYSVNNLNQYTRRTVPGAVDVLGAASSNSTVTVNNRASYRKGEYFRSEYPITNSAASVYQPLTNLAVLANGTNADLTVTNFGNLFLPQTPEIFIYDVDGNLIDDGRWALSWDAENRLAQMVSSTLPDTAKRKLEFAYDHTGRRANKKVSVWSEGAWQLSSENLFVYDEWNLAARLNVTNNLPVEAFTWGLDLSGSLQGAGGVGGLLIVNAAAFPGYNGNGDVVGLVASANGVISAQYEYDHFGQLLRLGGAMAKGCASRFSSRYNDEESDLLYYGFRYYNASIGRWHSRDPIDEQGQPNLYGFVLNQPNNRSDRLGMTFTWESPNFYTLPKILETSEGKVGGRASWVHFSPSAVAFPDWSQLCPCKYRISVGGSARAYAWWVAGFIQWEIHEKIHVYQHLRPAALGFKESAEAYENKCFSGPKAQCFAAMIVNEMKTAYMSQAAAMGNAFDCHDYGNDDPQSPPCTAAIYWANEYVKDLNAWTAAVANCDTK